MSKEEIKEELEYIDSGIIEAVIECCKQLFCDGVPLYDWNYDSVMKIFDKATQDWETEL